METDCPFFVNVIMTLRPTLMDGTFLISIRHRAIFAELVADIF